MIKAVHRLPDRPALRRCLAASVLALGLAGAGAAVAMAGPSSGHASAAAAPGAVHASPYFVCIGVVGTGLCVGPPTT